VPLTTTTRRRLLGLVLREYRQKVGCDMAIAAQVLDCDISKISRIETGQRGIRAKELKELLNAYGVHEEQQEMLLSLSGSRRDAPPAWWQGYTSLLVADSLEYLAVEEYASQIKSYGSTLIPELLQSEEYTFALATGDQGTLPGMKSHFATAVRARQHAILRSGRTNLNVVLSEAALRQEVGGRQLMQEQLRHLIELSAEMPWITVQVLPFSAGSGGITGGGSFSILRFQALPTLGLVHLAGPSRGVCLEQPQDVGVYLQAFEQAQAAAFSPAASRTFIQRLAES